MKTISVFIKEGSMSELQLLYSDIESRSVECRTKYTRVDTGDLNMESYVNCLFRDLQLTQRDITNLMKVIPQFQSLFPTIPSKSSSGYLEMIRNAYGLAQSSKLKSMLK